MSDLVIVWVALKNINKSNQRETGRPVYHTTKTCGFMKRTNHAIRAVKEDLDNMPDVIWKKCSACTAKEL